MSVIIFTAIRFAKDQSCSHCKVQTRPLKYNDLKILFRIFHAVNITRKIETFLGLFV